MQGRVHYKEFTEEEDVEYKKYVEAIRSNVRNGVKFGIACEAVIMDNGELRGMIIEDALKIEIADLHYGKGLTLAEVSQKLGVPMDSLLRATGEMMEDVINTFSKTGEGRANSGRGIQ